MKKGLKIVLIVILVLVGLPLIIALFVKKEYALVREVTINRPKQEVFDYIRLLKNQDNFSVWAKIDPAMKKEYRGTDGTVGFVAAWDSENKEAGKGEQEIKAIKDGERIDYELRFLEPMKATNNAFMTTEAVNDSTTKVSWGFNGKMPYPMNIMMLAMDMEAMVGKDFEQGLANLKTELEKK